MADTSIGKAYVQIVPTAEGISNKVEDLFNNKGVDKSADNTSKHFGKALLGGLAKLGIGAAVAKTFQSAISGGADLQQSFGGLDTLYGDAADSAKQYAYEAAQAGISANDYAEQAVSFGAALKQAFGGDTAQAAEAANTAIMDMADNAAKMGTDVESIQNAYQGFAKGNYTMLDNLKLGYGGTKEEMERLLSDAEKLPAAMGKDFDLSNLGDVYEAIHLIQDDLGLTGVAADEAATTFSGSFGAMKASASNMLSDLALGNDIQASLSSFGQSVNTFFVGNLLPMVGSVVKQIPTVIAQLPGFIADMIPQAIPAIVDMIGGFAAAVVENAPTFVAGVGEMLASAWDAIVTYDWSSAGAVIVSFLKAAWNKLTGAAEEIWATVVEVFTSTIETVPIISDAWSALTEFASALWNVVKGLFTGEISVTEILTSAWDAVTKTAETIWGTVVGLFTGEITVKDVLTSAWDTVSSTAESIWGAVEGFFTGDVEVTSIATDAWNTITDTAGTLWKEAKGIFEGAGPVVKNISLLAWATIQNTAESLWTAAKGVFEGAGPVVQNVVLTAWGTIQSTAEGLWSAAKGVFEGAGPVVKNVVLTAWGTLQGVAEGLWTAAKGIFEDTAPTVQAVVTEAWDTVTTTADTIWEGVKTTFESFDITWPDFGELAADALNGLKTAAEGVWNWIKGLFGGKEDEEAVTSVEGATSEMAATLADANLKISSVDLSEILKANEFVKSSVLMYKRVFDNMGLKFPHIGTHYLVVGKTNVDQAVEKYKSLMNFYWSLPTLHGHLPIISVTMNEASSSDGKTKVSYPSLSVSGFNWFAEGGIFSEPTVIGIGDSKGPEAAVPLDMMWNQMSKEFDKHLGNGAQVTNYFTVDGAQDPEQWAIGAARTIKRELRMA